jgi:hypothetical protein
MEATADISYLPELISSRYVFQRREILNEAQTYGAIAPATRRWRVRQSISGGNISLLAELLSILSFYLAKSRASGNPHRVCSFILKSIGIVYEAGYNEPTNYEPRRLLLSHL